ncbi:MAG: molecular chaperone DnaJ [Anaerolineales bacterium]
MPRDYYEVLELNRGASQEDIQKAFKRLARIHHPDVSDAPDAQARMQELNEAYQVLKDPDRRRAYDQFGHAGVNMGAGGFSDFGSIEDIFEEFMGAFTGRQRTTRRNRPRQGRDLRYDLHLSFEQAVFGEELDIDVTRWENCDTCDGSGAEPGSSPITCPECNGSGQIRQMRQTFLGSMVTVTDCPRCSGSGKIVETPCQTCKGKGRTRETRSLAVNIPAGVNDGTQIRLTGEGEPGENGGPPGNLYVVLSVDEHAYFKRNNHDILLEINVNVAQAALGDKVVVPTIYGEETIDIEPGTQTGTVIRLKNKGVPKLRSDGRTSGEGDQLCIVNVAVPKKLTAEQRELFEQLRGSLNTDLISVEGNKGGSIFDRVVNFFGGN